MGIFDFLKGKEDKSEKKDYTKSVNKVWDRDLLVIPPENLSVKVPGNLQEEDLWNFFLDKKPFNGIVYHLFDQDTFLQLPPENERLIDQESVIRDGIKHGVMKQFYRSQKLQIETNFISGKEHGLTKYWYENGQLEKEITYSNGEVLSQKRWDEDGNEIKKVFNYTGLNKEYYGTGQLKQEGHRKEGKPEGLWKTYHENGQLESEENYKNGERDGIIKIYYKNGQLEEDSNYKDGKRNGIFKVYYENGQLHQEGCMRNEDWEGSYKQYYENGQLLEIGNWKNGKMEGIMKRYFNTGQLGLEVLHTNDQLVSQKCWDEDGKEIECE